jgi:hypothetical protein
LALPGPERCAEASEGPAQAQPPPPVFEEWPWDYEAGGEQRWPKQTQAATGVAARRNSSNGPSNGPSNGLGSAAALAVQRRRLAYSRGVTALDLAVGRALAALDAHGSPLNGSV